jgi:hypothetical protein
VSSYHADRSQGIVAAKSRWHPQTQKCAGKFASRRQSLPWDYFRVARYPLAMSCKRQWASQRPKRFLHVEELSSLIAIEANLRWKRATRMSIR